MISESAEKKSKGLFTVGFEMPGKLAVQSLIAVQCPRLHSNTFLFQCNTSLHMNVISFSSFLAISNGTRKGFPLLSTLSIAALLQDELPRLRTQCC